MAVHPPGQRQPGIMLVKVDAQIGIVLVVLQKNIVEGLVLLDEVAFQRQGFQIGLAQHQVEIIHPADHGRYLGGVAAVKNTAAPGFSG